MIIDNAFNDINLKPLPKAESLYGEDYLDRVAGMQIGQGSKVLRADQTGLWLGASRFDDAPFRVDMLGALFAKSATFTDGADATIVDASGLVSTNNFVSDEIEIATTFETTSATYVDITDVTLTTPNFSRSKNVVILAAMNLVAANDAAGDFEGEINVAVTIDGINTSTMRMRGSYIAGEANSDLTPASNFDFVTLGTGTHVIKLQMKITNLGVGNFKGRSGTHRLGYIILGN
jgi:hypothetical protein